MPHPITVERVDAYYTPESIEAGDVDYHDPHGVVFTCDPEYTDADAIASEVADFLRREGVAHASSTHWHPGLWYSTECEPVSLFDDESRESAYFIKGASDDECRAIAQELARVSSVRVRLDVVQSSIW